MKKILCSCLLIILIFASSNALAQQGFNKLKINELTLPTETGASVLYLDNDKKVKSSDIDVSELENLQGTSSNLQTQINGKESTIPSGTTSDYFRGDKTFQPLTKATIGLGNVDNTSDMAKPVSTLTQNALDVKADASLVVLKTGNESISGVKTFTGKTVASSTTNGAIPCPVMTNTQMIAIASPQNGDCVFNSTNKSPYYYNTTDAAWKLSGGSGGGTFSNRVLIDDFEESLISQYTGADFSLDKLFPLHGKVSARMTHNLTGATKTIARSFYVDEGFRGKNSFASLKIKTDAALGNVKLSVGCTTSTDLINAVTVKTDNKDGIFTTNAFVIPSLCDLVTVTISGLPESTPAKITVVDDVELKLNNELQFSSVETQTSVVDASVASSSGTLTGSFSTSEGSGLYTYSSGIYTALKDFYLTISVGAMANSSSPVMVATVVNGKSYTKGMVASGAGAGWAASASWSGKVLAGQTFSANLNNGPTGYHSVSVQATSYENVKGISSTNGNTSWAPCGHTTSDFTGFGVVSSINLICKRDGDDLLMRGRFSTGTNTATEARVFLRFNGASLTSKALPAPVYLVGDMGVNTQSATYFRSSVLSQPSLGYVVFSNQTSTANSDSLILGTAIPSSSAVNIDARIPISGWENSNVIVANISEVPTTRGSNGADIQSVYFGGAAGCSTACTTGTCFICNTVGSKISSISWVSNGLYRLNGIDGAKYNCSGSAYNGSGNSPIVHDRPSSTSSYAAVALNSGAVNASYASVTCIGIP